MSADKFDLKRDEERTRSFTIEGFPTTFKDSDLRVVVFALSSNGGVIINDNLAVCPMGGSQDYVLN